MKKNIRVISLLLAATIALSGCGAEGVTSASVSETSVESSVSEVSTETSVSEETTEASVSEEDKDTTETTETAETSTETSIEETVSEDENVIVPLRDAVEADTGLFIGCATTTDEMKDDKVWEIITTHFNRVTLGNELKPDALVNYSVTVCPGTETVTFNGESFVVPKLDFTRPEKLLDRFVEWNKENPDRQILVRGHVLVWHSQTPEWFFHENYDKTQPYVSKAEMNKRLEWYIMTVLTHFTGENSKYKDLFYGWDVVNEAISDGDGGVGGLRTDAENPSESLNEDRHGSNSSWYHIYQSNEFIINAFKYANKYAPQSLELYYNDYNEFSFYKRKNIITLLEAIKAEEGEPGVGTRISAMGMQGHYSMDTPSADEIASTIKNYGKVVGKVQITELDISASSDYDGSAASVEEENEKLRKRYNMIYFGIKTAINGDNIDFEGLTFWGTVDQYSWLQSRSNIGGGNKTGLPQMPLLFDENYEPKPCFYVFSKKK